MSAKKIGFSLDFSSFEKHFRTEIYWRAYGFFNYITRRYKSSDVNFGQVHIIGWGNHDPNCHRNSDGILVVNLPVSPAKLQDACGVDLHELHIQILSEAIKVTEKCVELPAELIRTWIEDFRSQRYVNSWIFKTIRIPGSRKAELRFELTQATFIANLDFIDRDGRVSRSENVLTTPPDDVFFANKIKTLKLEDGVVVVKDKAGNLTFECRL